ncbi:MAG: hypothetical protein SNJ59_04950 [Aggregatilineales bacterium]
MSVLLLIAFPTRGQLVEAVNYIQSHPELKTRHSAVISKAEDGETMILDDDITPNEGAITGGTLGSLLGSLGIASLGAFLLPGIGPIVAVGAGALVGGLVGGVTGRVTASLIDMGINNQVLADLARHLENDRVAFVLEVDGTEEALQQLEADIARYEGAVSIIRPEP